MCSCILLFGVVECAGPISDRFHPFIALFLRKDAADLTLLASMVGWPPEYGTTSTRDVMSSVLTLLIALNFSLLSGKMVTGQSFFQR